MKCRNYKFCNEKVLPSKPFGIRTFFCNWVKDGTIGAVKCYVCLRGDNVKHVLADNLKDEHGALNKWKVLTSRANGAGQECDENGAKSVLADTIIAAPSEACTETLIVAGTFRSKKEAENYAVYAMTKFYRFMLSLRVVSQDINKKKFTWVPDLGNYSKAWTDKDLYAHFELTKKEIEHIEKSIKSLD